MSSENGLAVHEAAELRPQSYFSRDNSLKIIFTSAMKITVLNASLETSKQMTFSLM